jgi:hypothetical protein
MEVYQAIKSDVLNCCCWALIALGILYFLIGKDATDPPNGKSGLRLKIDCGTGLHYLEGSGGVLCPRLDRDGKQMADAR